MLTCACKPAFRPIFTGSVQAFTLSFFFCNVVVASYVTIL